MQRKPKDNSFTGKSQLIYEGGETTSTPKNFPKIMTKSDYVPAYSVSLELLWSEIQQDFEGSEREYRYNSST